MELREFLDKLNLMELIIKDNLLKIIVHKLYSHQQEEYYLVVLKINKKVLVQLNVINSQILSICKNFKHMIQMVFKNFV
jgi:hypothetical protein